LAEVYHLQGVVVYLHDAVLWIFAALEAGGDEAVVDQSGGVGVGEEDAGLVVVGVAVELAADGVGVAVDQG
jgi:hypothetical protein